MALMMSFFANLISNDNNEEVVDYNISKILGKQQSTKGEMMMTATLRWREGDGDCNEGTFGNDGAGDEDTGNNRSGEVSSKSRCSNNGCGCGGCTS